MTGAGAGMPRGVSAHMRIREMILAGDIPPGAPVVESDLAQRLGVSRTPVREGLKRLELEGLLRPAEGRGLCAATISVKEAEELFYMREATEGMAARLAALRADFRMLGEMERHLAEEAATGAERPDRLLAINDAFHRCIHVASDNRYVLEAVERFGTGMAVLRNMTREGHVPMPEAHAAHLAIFHAIEREDPVAAEEAARAHVRMSRRKRLKLLAVSLGEGG